MNVLIAPDKFKGCLTADEAARLMALGVRRAFPAARVRRLPLADGGDGTAAALRKALGGRLQRAAVLGPDGKKIRASWVWSPRLRVAVVELAQASGLALLSSKKRNPLFTTTYGTGQLMRAALDRGAREIRVALGGSATVDGGLGMLQALGARAFLKDGRFLEEPGAGRHLPLLGRIDLSRLDPRLKKTRVTLLCDVENPLLGPRGAARVFGPQKGASSGGVSLLEEGLRRWAGLLLKETGVDVAPKARMGPAGGAAAGLAAGLGARALSGIGAVMEALDVEAQLRWADVVLTGEGAVDRTSMEGKVLAGVLRRAGRARKPVLVLAGAWGKGAAAVRRKFSASSLVAPGASLQESLRRTPRLMPGAAAGLLSVFLKARPGGRRLGARGGRA